jgi:hypothetical protein
VKAVRHRAGDGIAGFLHHAWISVSKRLATINPGTALPLTENQPKPKMRRCLAAEWQKAKNPEINLDGNGTPLYNTELDAAMPSSRTIW